MRIEDALGIQGRRSLNETDSNIKKGMSIWVRPLVENEFALAVVSFRTDGIPQSIEFTLRRAGLKDVGQGEYMCADIYDPNHKVTNWTMDQKVTLYLTPDSILMYRCYPMHYRNPQIPRDIL